MSPHDRSTPVTIDDLVVETLEGGLLRLPRLADAPGLDRERTTAYVTAEESVPRDEDGSVDVDAVRGDLAETEYGTHFERLVEWADRSAPLVDAVVLPAESDRDSPGGGGSPRSNNGSDFGAPDGLSLSLWGTESRHASPFHCRVDYEFDGEIFVRLAVFPEFETNHSPFDWELMDETTCLTADGASTRRVRLDQFDSARVTDDLVGRMPYVTSRVAELHEAGFSFSEARGRAYREAGVGEAAAADRLGIQEGAVRSYFSKGRERTRKARRAYFSTFSVPPLRLLATAELGPDEGRPTGRLSVAAPIWHTSGSWTDRDRRPESWREFPGGTMIYERCDRTAPSIEVLLGDAEGTDTTPSDEPPSRSSPPWSDEEQYRHWAFSIESVPFRRFRDLLDLLLRAHRADHLDGSHGAVWGSLLRQIPAEYLQVADDGSYGEQPRDHDPDAVDRGEWWL